MLFQILLKNFISSNCSKFDFLFCAYFFTTPFTFFSCRDVRCLVTGIFPNFISSLYIVNFFKRSSEPLFPHYALSFGKHFIDVFYLFQVSVSTVWTNEENDGPISCAIQLMVWQSIFSLTFFWHYYKNKVKISVRSSHVTFKLMKIGVDPIHAMTGNRFLNKLLCK